VVRGLDRRNRECLDPNRLGDRSPRESAEALSSEQDHLINAGTRNDGGWSPLSNL
jgi:hypothetical protein